MTIELRSDNVLGRPDPRIDGRMKVTGAARYGVEHAMADEAATGMIVGASIARGRIIAIDTAAAEASPGVLRVFTHLTMPPQPDFGASEFTPDNPPFSRARPTMATDRIDYFDQPIAFVVAESFEEARAAAQLVTADYATEPAATTLDSAAPGSYRPERVNANFETDTSTVDDPEAAIAVAEVALDRRYVNDYQHHAPMEPHGCVASWRDGRLTVHLGTQMVNHSATALAATLGIARDDVRLISPFIGGGFGSKILVHSETVLAAFAARELDRPVKAALTRPQMFANAGHRPGMDQRVRLAAARDGTLAALVHDVVLSTARSEEFVEQAATSARSLYAAPALATSHRAVPMDVRRGEWMRAPGEASGLLAIECAMDELAVELGLDPLELRRRNEPDVDPTTGKPFAGRRLLDCIEDGARRFGWEARAPAPRSRREGPPFIGQGFAVAIRPNLMAPSSARVTWNASGQATVECDMTDIGTGSYTILGQIAAEALGLRHDAVSVRLGDSHLQVTPGSGGSFGAGSVGTAVVAACTQLREAVVAAGRDAGDWPFADALAEALTFADGRISDGAQSRELVPLLGALSDEARSQIGETAPGEAYETYSQQAYGAHFAEVSVDAATCEVRLRRMTGVFDAGRILNPRLALSQIKGGMLWGVGGALMEGSNLDPRNGWFVGSDLASYHVMSHADAPMIEAHFLDGFDALSNPMGSRGIGELGVCGSGAAVANAVYDAVGARVRHFPLTPDRIMAAVPD